MVFSTSTLKTLATAIVLLAQQTVAASFNADSKENVALYWGQNSAGSQERLSYYCESDAADILLLSFMTEFSSADGSIALNFASACTSTFSDGLLECDTIAADILTCQSLGKKVLLSLGGASGSYGFSSDSDAEGFAETLWNTFGAGSADERPFGDSIVDGFDFDIENNNDVGYAALATKLRTYYAEDTSKDYYISAAPQCPYPDASIGDMLSNAEVDFAFIQFYNNYCNLDGTEFNWSTWTDYATETSPNKNIKLFIGLPGASSAAGSGYSTVSEVESALAEYVVNVDDANFGGIMMWDASQAFANDVTSDQNFAEAMKSLLTSAYGSETSTSTSTKSTSTTSTKATATTTSTTSSSSSSSSTSTTVVVPTTTSTSTTVAPTTTSTSTSSTETTSSSSSTTETPVAITTIEPVPVTSTEAAPVTTTSTETETSAATTSSSVVTTSTAAAPVTTSTTAAPVPTTSLTTLSTVVTSSTTEAATSTSAAATTVASDCSGLTGTDLAKCYNTNFAAGLYLGSASSCSLEGQAACSPDGTFSVCNYGKWVDLGCASGTTCFAYTTGDEVDIGCNYESLKSSFTKRDGSSFMDLFKRGTVAHRHHEHN